MPPACLPTVRWIGVERGREFGRCRAFLDGRAHVVGPGIDGKADLTVFATSRPLGDPELVAGFVADPTAGRVVQLLGAWCEGEQRTGRVAPGAERVFWHAWPWWWLAEVSSPPAGSRPRGLVRIDSPDSALAAALGERLAAEGIDAVWSRRHLAAAATAIVWDGAQFGGREADRLAAVCSAARLGRVPVVALLDFPRADAIEAAEQTGAAAVLGKPLPGELLVAALRNVGGLPPVGVVPDDLGEGDLAAPAGLVDGPAADALDGRPAEAVGFVSPVPPRGVARLMGVELAVDLQSQATGRRA